MDKTEFMKILRAGIIKLPYQKAEEVLIRYEEYFIKAGPENEQDVLSRLESPVKIANDIMFEYEQSKESGSGPQKEEDKTKTQNTQYENYDFSKYSKGAQSDQTINEVERQKRNKGGNNKRRRSILEIALLILVLPFILAGIIVLIGILFSIEVTLLAFLIASVGVTIAGIVSLIGGFLTVQTMEGIISIGVAFVCFGVGILLESIVKVLHEVINKGILKSSLRAFSRRREF